MHKLKGINSFVTGGSRGIGLEIAKELAKLGSNVCILSRNSELNDKVVKEQLPIVHKEQKHFGISYDLSRSITDIPNNLEPTINSLVSEKLNGKGFSIFIHSAGITQSKLLYQTKDIDIQSVMNINTLSAMSLTRCFLRDMMKEKTGRIILIGSILASTGLKGESVYSASKSALSGFTKSIAQEMGRMGITCNLISPCYVETDMLKKSGVNLDRIPKGKLVQPKDIANAALTLINDPKSNGVDLKIDEDWLNLASNKPLLS